MKIFILFFLFANILMMNGCSQDSETPITKKNKDVYKLTIVALGDSLTAGFGVPIHDSYPAKLERELKKQGISCRVVNAGISGETSSGALSRLDWTMNSKPDIIIIETGANDGMRGISPAVTRKNIETIIQKTKDNKITPILTGMRMLENLGEDFTNSFNRIYPEIAVETGVIFMPFFLQDVAAEPDLNINDGIHPNSSGYSIIVKNILPFVLKAVKKM